VTAAVASSASIEKKELNDGEVIEIRAETKEERDARLAKEALALTRYRDECKVQEDNYVRVANELLAVLELLVTRVSGDAMTLIRTPSTVMTSLSTAIKSLQQSLQKHVSSWLARAVDVSPNQPPFSNVLTVGNASL
jgi:hypothetical protein